MDNGRLNYRNPMKKIVYLILVCFSVWIFNASQSFADTLVFSNTKVDAAKQSSQSNNPSAWSANDLKLARSSVPTTITFTNKSGLVVSNAEVVRVIDGVNLIWRSGPTSGGMVKLADLPEDLRDKFGYDAAKTEVADALAKEQKGQWQQQVLAAQTAQTAQQSQAAAAAQSSGGYSQFHSSGSDYSSGGGSVYVRGYTRKDGAYVQSHYRSR